MGDSLVTLMEITLAEGALLADSRYGNSYQRRRWRFHNLFGSFHGNSELDVVNRPSDGFERPVGNGLLILNTAPAENCVNWLLHRMNM